jgi:hypothetical protein
MMIAQHTLALVALGHGTFVPLVTTLVQVHAMVTVEVFFTFFF